MRPFRHRKRPQPARHLALLTTVIWILTSGIAPAILDVNANGLSDLWEKQHNSGLLFPGSFNTQADPDADGWTNMEEAVAGTDPFFPNPSEGIIRPDIAHIPAEMGEENGAPVVVTPEFMTVSWPTLPGKLYRLQFSPDLGAQNWLPVGDPFIALGGVSEYNLDVGNTDSRFWRVAVEDTDTDNDGLTNHEEHLYGTDPAQPMSFAGAPDAWLAEHFPNLGAFEPDGDPDGDGIGIVLEQQLGLNPNSTDQTGPVNLGFDEEITDSPTLSFREEYPSDVYEHYSDKKCTHPINLTPSQRLPINSSNPLPEKVFMRAESVNFTDPNNPQVAGDLKLMIKPTGGAANGIEAAKIKLTVVKEIGAGNYFQAARDYILENNTELYVDDRGFPSDSPSSTIRICAMLEEKTVMIPYESYHWDALTNYNNEPVNLRPATFIPVSWAEGLGIQGVMNMDNTMTVVINGNQCGFSDGTTSAEALTLYNLGDPLMTDKCQGRLAMSAVLNPSSNDHYNETTNAPGTSMKGSPLAGPDPIPGSSDPGGKYLYQGADGKYMMGAGRMPVNLAPPGTLPMTPVAQNGIGGLSSSYGSGDRSNYPNSFVGFHPLDDNGVTGKGVVFVAMGKGGQGNGKVPEFYQAAKSSGIPEIPGATKSGTYDVINLLMLDSGDTSCALAHKTPSNNFVKVYEGHKHRGMPYYVNTFLRFKSSKPR